MVLGLVLWKREEYLYITLVAFGIITINFDL
jgi:hypothetical protein